MLLSEIAVVLNQKTPAFDAEINWLLTDSRLLAFPSETLFFALVTKRNNAHRFIPELYSKGVKAFVVSEMCEEFQKLGGAVFFQVQDTLRTLQNIATFHRLKFEIPVIGITGSNGKTIVKEWLFQMLHNDYNIVRSPRSYNSQTGVPLSVWQLNHNATLAIFEAGISEPGEMQHLQQIIKPSIGIFCNIGDAHQEFFPDIETKISEKAILFCNADKVIHRTDNEILNRQLKTLIPKERLLSWGSSNDADFRIIDKKIDSAKTVLNIEANHQKFTVCIPFTDEASVENAMHCVVFMWFSGFDIAYVNARLQKLEPVAMRLELKEGKNGCLILNDSYNSDLHALGIALDLLRQQAETARKKSTLILSDILQTGFELKELYKQVSLLLQSRKVDCLIGVGKQISSIADLFEVTEKHFFHHTEELIASSKFSSFSNEVILLKGSRPFLFENLSSRLELIVHETRLEVNLNALINNFNYFRGLMKPGVKVMCMVKAFAYGSGSVEIARALQHHGCDAVAVAVADEGAELRKAGIHIPIVVMNPEKSAFDVLFEHNLEPEIYSFKLLKDLVSAAQRRGITSYPVHIEIDSGMCRLGFDPAEVPELIRFLLKQQAVKVRSVFSHLAGAENPSHDEFTSKQAQVFVDCKRQFTQAFVHQILYHLLNSAGAERFPEYQLDMIRTGIGLYGVTVLHDNQLNTVCSLKTIVLQLKQIVAGQTVGYNRNAKVDSDRIIATLPLGYADGFDRKLGNGLGQVFINGKRAAVIGNVSMDLTTVDVTGIDVKEGDEVEVFGNQITITEIASKIGTIPYEILTGISRRVKRVYIQE